jgi:hypothetical protein
MNTSRKAGPASQKPSPLSPDDERLLAFQPGEMTAETREAIAAHRARYVEARKAREAMKTRDPVIRQKRDSRFDEGFIVSGLMPLDEEAKS